MKLKIIINELIKQNIINYYPLKVYNSIESVQENMLITAGFTSVVVIFTDMRFFDSKTAYYFIGHTPSNAH